MRTRNAILLLFWTGTAMLSAACTRASSPAGGDNAKTPAAEVHGNLAHVMRGILFPNANVIFAAQDEKAINVKPAEDPSLSTNPLTGAYGGWEAVQNSALALAESANLLTIAGRRCANGRPVPIDNPDWPKFVQGLRDAGMAAAKAAESKSQDSMVMAADTMTTACSNCHDKYRDKPGGDADRCM